MGAGSSKARTFLKGLDLEDGLSQEQLKQTWDLFDLDGDGMLNESEAVAFFTAYAKAKDIENAAEAGRAFFQRYQNGDGYINYQELVRPEGGLEFLATLNLDVGLNEEERNQVWDSYDVDGDGFLNRVEALQFFTDYAKAKKWGRNPRLAEEFLEKFDTDDDGRIDQSDFAATGDVSSTPRTRKRGVSYRRPEELEVHLQRPLGLQINDSPWGAFVQAVLADGSAAKWNKEEQEQMIQVGHFLIAMNSADASERMDLRGLTHGQVFERFRLVPHDALTIYLAPANVERRAYIDWYLLSTTEDAVGKTYKVTLGRPFGCIAQQSPWGTYIRSLSHDGTIPTWNASHHLDGRHIQVGDFILGYEDVNGKAMLWDLPSSDHAFNSPWRLEQAREHYAQCGEFMKNLKDPVVTLILRRRTLHEKAVTDELELNMTVARKEEQEYIARQLKSRSIFRALSPSRSKLRSLNSR